MFIKGKCMEQQAIHALADRIRAARRIVFFGGAGVSTESGIPDFRGNGGLYQKPDETFDVPPETILSHDYLRMHPDRFYRYYRRCMLYPQARPNAAHLALAELERLGKLTAVVTQNIDGLHQLAGSKEVIELHGSVLRNYCVSCGREYPLSFVESGEGIPFCEKCGRLVRPDVVLYGEGLDGALFERASDLISQADMLLIGGTSLTVYPAASLVRYYRGDHLILLNRDPTPYDAYAEMIIRDPIGQVLGAVMEELNKNKSDT